MAITQVGIPFINKNKLDLFLNYTIVEVQSVSEVTEEEAYAIINALSKAKENKLPILIIKKGTFLDYVYILSYTQGYGVYVISGIGSSESDVIYNYIYTLGTDPSGEFHHDVVTYDILTSEDAKKYALLDSSNSFNNLQTFSEVKVNSYLDINYPDIDIIRISENTNGQLQFDFSRVGGGTTVLPSGSANNTATIITTDNIAANVANKLDKVTTVDTTKLYMKNADGTQGMIALSQSPSGNSVIHRDANGKSQISTPTDSDTKYITNVEYVKNYVTNNSSKLTVTDNEDGTLTLSF